ncbi:BPSS1780 family membrane protein [Uliginosibacterium sp. H3]|uniref:BPSS1780 family membrane protein n=1 Tax=Uliginosibacterium silvisoli TaxID=3114758 RepID=A0ABU6K1M0_9RHOO|nr:BPSS1780 family membrane protein [Uliginosibacterium sp. H3]
MLQTSSVPAVPRSARKPVIRKLSASQAFSWLGSGWSLFIGQPVQWALMALAVFIIMALVSTVLVPLPIIGPMAGPVLFVLLTGGMLSAAERQSRGETVRFLHLFDGFRVHGGSLALVGVLFSIPLVLMLLVVQLALVGGLLAGVLGAVLGSALSSLLSAATAFISVLVTGLGVSVFIYLLMILALVNAPALVTYRALPPLEALGLSLKASLRNLGATLLFGLLMYVLFAVSLMPAGLGVLIFIPVSVGALRQACLDMYGDAVHEV